MQPAETADIDEPVEAVATRMGVTRVGAFAVTEKGALAGVVSVIDVLLAHRANQQATARTAHDAMTANPPTLCPEQTLVEAVRIMCDQHLHELAVTDDSGRVVGMITEADVRRAVGDPALYLDRSSPAVDVQDVMETGIPQVRDDRPIAEVAHYFADTRLEALPVVDANGALVGVMSYLDTLNALAR
jgi:CBS domain-containing protein